MSMYLWLKWIHILSAALLLGTGLGIAFFMWMAHRTCDARVIASTARVVVLADACFTAPAVVVQLVTGIWLAQVLSIPLTHFWILLALLLFALTGACWLPVVWLQIRARDLAERAACEGVGLPDAYHRTMRWWFWLGWPAFASVLAIYWLMVHKPA